MSHQPLQLMVQEPQPGAFLWVLMETDAEGSPAKVASRAEDTTSSYEAALAAGTRALNAELHRGTQPHH